VLPNFYEERPGFESLLSWLDTWYYLLIYLRNIVSRLIVKALGCWKMVLKWKTLVFIELVLQPSLNLLLRIPLLYNTITSSLLSSKGKTTWWKFSGRPRHLIFGANMCKTLIQELLTLFPPGNICKFCNYSSKSAWRKKSFFPSSIFPLAKLLNSK